MEHAVTGGARGAQEESNSTKIEATRLQLPRCDPQLCAWGGVLYSDLASTFSWVQWGNNFHPIGRYT